MDAREAEAHLGEQVEVVIVRYFGGALGTIKREQLLSLDLGGLAVAWKDAEGKTHRSVGVPLEVITVESRIIQPV